MYGGGYGGQGGEYGMMQDQNYYGMGGVQDPYAQQQMMGMPGGYDGMGGFAGGYPMQPQPMYDANGYPMAGQGAAPGQAYAGGYAAEGAVYPSGDDRHDVDQQAAMARKKSFTGPPEGDNVLAKARSLRQQPSRRGSGEKSAGGGLARNGSVFQMGRTRSTQRSVSTRGGFESGDVDVETLEQYYGDMAKRTGDQRYDGFKATKSYRGDIEAGQDVGKPRRVTGVRNVQGKSSTGYGGLNFKRQCAMRNGESWGDIEVRRTGGSGAEGTPKTRGIGFNMDDEARRQQEMEEYMRRMREAELAAMMQQQQMMAMMDQPAVPQVFNREDVRTYSNLSDAFSGDHVDDDEGL